MDTISPQQLHALSQQRNRFCLSIFMPTHSAGPETRQNPIRFKNLIRRAEEKLLGEKLRRSVAGGILGPARQLADRSAFWRAQSDGLAIYLSEGFFQYFRVPVQFPERLCLADHFEVTPLLPLFAGGGRYYLLALSQKQARLFEGTPSGLRELNAENLPHGVADSLKYDVHERPLQMHGAAHRPGIRLKEGAVFHGQDQNQVEVHEKAEPGDEDLVNAVAVQTILHRDAVYTVPQIPGPSPAAAVYRYVV